MTFKDASPLFKKVEFLSQETRLECNQEKQERHVDRVQQEIMQTRAKIDFYKNREPDQFPQNSDKFK